MPATAAAVAAPTPTPRLDDVFEGVVQGSREGHGWVVGDQGLEAFLPPREMAQVLHRDRVRAVLARRDQQGRFEARVEEVLERASQLITGTYRLRSNKLIVTPLDARLPREVLVSGDATGRAREGNIVVVRLDATGLLVGRPIGKVVEVLGEMDDAGIEIEIAVRQFNLPHLFSPAAQAQADKLPEQVQQADTRGRINLCDVPLVTIDGEDARDFDDAVYAEPHGSGAHAGWRLLVAIADVSHYVRPGQPLDLDAATRGTSVYFPRRVIPMLPEKLSNGLCSLNPLVPRLALVCDMLVSRQGKLRAYQFYPALMRSKARLTYTEVAELLSDPQSHAAQEHASLVPHLRELRELYRALLKARELRGALEFEVPEVKIVTNAAGRIERIEPRTRNEAHRLIEECMLIANVAAADFLHRTHPGALFRVHERPSVDKLQTLNAALASLGLRARVGGEAPLADWQRVIEESRERPDAANVHMLMLRAQMQARYQPQNLGHYGLAYEAYTHFTSPIRRYPDLLVHRAIKAALQGEHYVPQWNELPTLQPAQASKASTKAASATAPAGHGKTAAGRAKGESGKREQHRGEQHEAALWLALGQHCSTLERRAEEASRDVEAWLKCEFMRDRLGNVYSGQVTAVTSFGLFVQLDDFYVDGLIHISELGRDYFQFDAARLELVGVRSGVRYRLGQRLDVQITRVDSEARRMDFRLHETEPDATEDKTASPGRAGRSLRSSAAPKLGKVGKHKTTRAAR